MTRDEIKILPLIEMQRIITLFGGWAGLINIQEDEKMEDDPTITVRDYLTKRIKIIFPHLQVLKAKWSDNDLLYYNDILSL